MKRKSEAEEAIERLRQMLPPGSTVRTILRHVSRSGMSRSISPVIDGEDYSWLVARAGRFTFDRKAGGVKMGGCGMDMGFALVYELSACLYPKGHGCIGEGCPSNDHSNGDRDYTPHEEHPAVCTEQPESCTARKHWHKDGGYALRHRWL